MSPPAGALPKLARNASQPAFPGECSMSTTKRLNDLLSKVHKRIKADAEKKLAAGQAGLELDCEAVTPQVSP
jgi:hypothetical protein